MATHRCKTECFHNAHKFDVGEEATFGPDEAVPEHFEPIEGESEPEAGDASSGKGGKKKGADK